MKFFEGSRSLIVAKCWPIIEAITPWLRKNWKYCAVSLFAWLFYFAMYYGRQLKYFGDNKIDSDQVRERKDVSTSIATMEPLLRTEQKLVQALNEYANQLQRKVDTIRRGIATMRKPPFIYSINEEEFLGNPFNSFPMLRRLKHEWKAWEKYLKAPEKTEHLDVIHKTLENMEDFDLTESVQGVERLRDIYGIQPSEWTAGKLHFGEYEIRFTSLDCYAVGFLLHKQEMYEVADEWFEAALNSYGSKSIYKYLGFNVSIIYETYVDNLIKQNRTALALMFTNTGLKRDPDNLRLIEKKLLIESLNVSTTTTKQGTAESKLGNSIRRGCRGEYVYNASSQLLCYYNWASSSDFARLAPFKVEELLDDPKMWLFHDVLSDDEAFTLKSMAKDRLKRSETVDKNTIKIRTSKSAWISDHNNSLTKTLNQRIEDMTGLYTIGSSLLIGNYGLGGHYGAHCDCLLDCNVSADGSGCDQRLATVLIYMTTVESGGATIFPKLEIGVSPEKGTALVWYGLKNNMCDCDLRTLHMACPVLFGSKWFLIKWIHFKNQVFRKPCFKENAISVN